MKIHYYAQSVKVGDLIELKECYLKELSAQADGSRIEKKEHFHKEYEIHFILRGSQEYTVGEKRLRMKAGEYLVIAPNVKHRSMSLEGDVKKISLVFGLSEEDLSRVVGSEYIYGEIEPEIGCILSSIVDNCACLDALGQEAARTGVYSLILLFLRKLELKTKECDVQVAEDVRVSMAKTFLSDNLQNRMDARDAARYCAISRRQLDRLFFCELGYSVCEYLERERVRCIRENIKNKAIPLKEIARLSGFGNEYYFNTFFKKHFGLTPGAYRRSIE